MEITIHFASENAAFEDNNGRDETVRILRHLADLIERGNDDGAVMDYNGNKVGRYDFAETEPES